MNSDKNTIKLLGAAFLLQALSPMIGGLIRDSIIGTGDITESMTNISKNAGLMRVSIAVEMISAIGVVLLGVLLYVTLKNQDMKIALMALGLYLIEVAALIISQIAIFALLHTSQESVIAGHPDNLQTLGTLFLELHELVCGSVLMLVFSLGALLFYYLFYKSGYLPKGLVLFGLLVALLSLIGTMFVLLSIDIPIYVVLILHLPFEIGTGLWLLVKGIKDGSETK